MVPARETREWHFQVAFVAEPQPSATFYSRESAIPGWVGVEADRFFSNVLIVLEGMEIEVDTPPSPDSQSPDTRPAELELEALPDPDKVEAEHQPQ